MNVNGIDRTMLVLLGCVVELADADENYENDIQQLIDYMEDNGIKEITGYYTSENGTSLETSIDSRRNKFTAIDLVSTFAKANGSDYGYFDVAALKTIKKWFKATITVEIPEGN